MRLQTEKRFDFSIRRRKCLPQGVRVDTFGVTMRLDKFLKVSRILKRRTVAQEACDSGKVDVNGRPAKPGCQLKVGDLVCVHFAGGSLSFKVLLLKETVKKEEASEMYEIILEQ